MKILYAVQATGNGHIARARMMAKAFARFDCQVDWFFSGRKRHQLFDMQEFGDFTSKDGLTFHINNGRIRVLKTLCSNNLLRFIFDVFTCDLSGYDLIINDFEPITAWAAKLRKIRCIGLSNQMALKDKLPFAQNLGWLSYFIDLFAPTREPIGMHWARFSNRMLPPVIDTSLTISGRQSNQILVYYPFCPAQELIELLIGFDDFEFHIFHGEDRASEQRHLHFYAFSKENFHRIQKQCCGVIAAAGFELPSESIHLGQKLLIVPLKGQIEQQINAAILKLIKRACVVEHLSREVVEKWLAAPQPQAKPYPEVAYAIAEWLINRETVPLEALSARLWELYDPAY